MKTYQFNRGNGFVFEVKAESKEQAQEIARVRLNTRDPKKLACVQID